MCIVYDPVRSTQGTFGLRALRLTENFMEIYKVRLVAWLAVTVLTVILISITSNRLVYTAYFLYE